MSGPSAQQVSDAGRSRLLDLVLVALALVCGWFIIGTAAPASASEKGPDGNLLGPVTSVVSTTIDVVEAPVERLVAPAPAPAPAALVPAAPAPAPVAADAPAALPVVPARVTATLIAPINAAPAPVPAAPLGLAPAVSVPVVGSIVPAVDDIVVSTLDLAGSGIVSPTTDSVDDIVTSVPATTSLFGPAPISSLTAPVTGAVDAVLSGVTHAIPSVVDDATDPLAGGVVDLIPDREPLVVGAPVQVSGGVESLASLPIPASTSISIAETDAGQHLRRIGTDRRVDRSVPAATVATSSASGAAVPGVPSAPGVPFSPAASTTASSIGAPTTGGMTVATIDHGIELRLTASRLAIATDDSTPFSLSNDPGSSPD